MRKLDEKVRIIGMREDTYSFLDGGAENAPFFMEMAGISYCDGSYSIRRKDSPIYVLEYVLEGQGTVKTDAEEFTAARGDTYLLHRHSGHWYYSSAKDPWVKIWVNAKGSLIDSLIHVYGLDAVTHVQGADTKSLLFELLDLAKSAQDKSSEDFSMEASTIYHKILIKLSQSLNRTAERYSEEALKLRGYIDRNSGRSLSLEELGNVIYRSPSQVVRIFKKEFFVTPYQYLLQRRLEIAKLMLLNTGMSVKQIAIHLHFADEHYFSSQFKEKAGVSPTVFRKHTGRSAGE